MQSTLHAARLLYFAYSAHYPEAQLSGAVACIESLLSLTPDEENVLSKELNTKGIKHKSLKATNVITRLFTVESIRDVAELNTQPYVFHVFAVRNNVLHNGGTCNYQDVCGAYRLAIRVLLSVPMFFETYEDRYSLVSSILKQSSGEEPIQAKILTAKDHSYEWYRDNIPDFLPFISSAYYSIDEHQLRSHTLESLTSSCVLLSEIRGLDVEKSYSALVQSDFTGSINFTVDQVLSRYFELDSPEKRVLNNRPRKSSSKLAWH